MFSHIGAPALGVLVLSACAPHSSIKNGAVVLEEQVALSRGSVTDGATRELKVDSDSILVAMVDENLTDVALEIAISKSGKGAASSIEVENHLDGAGIEIAVLAVPAGSRAVLTLTSPASSSRPAACSCACASIRTTPGAIRGSPRSSRLSRHGPRERVRPIAGARTRRMAWKIRRAPSGISRAARGSVSRGRGAPDPCKCTQFLRARFPRIASRGAMRCPGV